jgi:hypothetical protein
VQGRNPRGRLVLGGGGKLDCPEAVGAIAGTCEDNAFVGSDGDFVGVKLYGTAIVTKLADRE